MNAETIKDFLVSLGFQVDKQGADNFDRTLYTITSRAVKLGAAVEGAALSVVAFTAKIASSMDSLYWMSQRTGATVAGIQQVGYAVSQLGGTAEGARSSLEGLARFVRNSPGAEGFLNRLGVQTRDASGNMRDMASIFTGVGQQLNKLPYYRANQYAQMLGIDENTLMAMRRGLGQFSAQYSQMAKAIGFNADQAAVSSNKFMTSLRSFGQMAGMARDKIGSNLADGLSGSIDTLRKQVVDNFPKIEGVITSSVKGILWLAEVIGRVVYRLIQAGADIMEWWSSLDKSTQRLIEIFGALVIAWRILNGAFLMSPIGIITALSVAILALYDDYKTWKEGGKSLIDWKKWEPEITNAIKAVDDLKNRVMSLLGIDPKTWSAKWDLSNLTENLGSLAKMLDGIARLLNAIKDGRWKDAYSIGREIMQQKGSSDAMPQVSGSANGVADWIKGKTGFDPRSIGQYFTGDDAGGDLKRGERNNNPGNLNYVGQAGASLERPGGRFAKFETAYDGLRAMARQLTLYAQRGINTVQGIISTWAPSSENNTGAYVNAIASKLGINPNAALNLQNPQVLSQLMDGIIRHENGRNIYPSELVNRAAGGAPVINQETNIHMHGVFDPAQAGKAVAEQQTSVNSRFSQTLAAGPR